MAYTTKEEVKEVLKGTEGNIPAAADKLSDEQLDGEIRRAEVEIDLVLGKEYVVPFDPVPDAISIIARDMAVYFADLLFRMSNDYDSPLDPILLRYKEVRGLLDGLKSGKYRLGTGVARRGGDEVFNPYDGELITVEHLFGPAIYG